MERRYRNTDAEYLEGYPQSLRRQSFCFENDNEVKSVFLEIWPLYKRALETNVSNDTAFLSSKEAMALGAMIWNAGRFGIGTGRNIIGPSLLAAIQGGNRAQAWFEIRYQSNGGGATTEAVKRGIAKGRYFESQLFGLYNDVDHVSSSEAKNIYQLIQQERDVIFAYEQKYGVHPDGRNSDVNTIPDANATYSSVISHVQSGEVLTLEAILNPAKDALLASLGSEYASSGFSDWFNKNTLISTNVYVGKENEAININASNYEQNRFASGADDLMIGGNFNDTLRGGKGHDVLIGNNGNDELFGGEGNDYLYGGEGDDYLDGGSGGDTLEGGLGFDTYIAGAGDTIRDADGLGVVKLHDLELKGGAHKAEYGEHVYRSNGVDYYWDGGTTLHVNGGQSNGGITIEYFLNGDLGINLGQYEEENVTYIASCTLLKYQCFYYFIPSQWTYFSLILVLLQVLYEYA